MRQRPILPFMPRPQTVDDYFALDDPDCRVELIDGVFVVSASPSFAHQRAVFCLGIIIETQAKKLRLGKVMCLPLDTMLSRTSVVHPDVMFLSKETLRRVDNHLKGPPDLAVEFLSPFNEDNDLKRKMKIYLEFGVPEYWIGDLNAKTIRVLENVKGRWKEKGTFKPGDTIETPRMPGIVVAVSEVYEDLV